MRWGGVCVAGADVRSQQRRGLLPQGSLEQDRLRSGLSRSERAGPYSPALTGRRMWPVLPKRPDLGLGVSRKSAGGRERSSLSAPHSWSSVIPTAGVSPADMGAGHTGKAALLGWGNTRTHRGPYTQRQGPSGMNVSEDTALAGAGPQRRLRSVGLSR